MALRALASHLKLESPAGFSSHVQHLVQITGWPPSLHTTSLTKCLELPPSMAAQSSPTSYRAAGLSRASLLIQRKGRLQSLKMFAQKTGTESLLPYLTQHSSHQTHSD